MWTKICANTNLRDAALAAELGADAVGFVFAPSKRQMTVGQVAAITPLLPGSVEKIGVVAGWSAHEIVEAVEVGGLTGVQLHGAMDFALLAALTESLEGRCKLIQTIGVETGMPLQAVCESVRRAASVSALWAILLDTSKGGVSGGLGVPFDWSATAKVIEEILANSGPDAPELIVAGGLHAGNVQTAIATLNPFGVDVASGVEAEPGQKDPAKVRSFLDAVRDSRPA